MLLTSFFGWWYGAGFKKQLEMIQSRLIQMADFFSIGLLLKTLFQPFRMLDANTSTKGPLEVRLQVAMGKLVSRLIGAFMRSLVMLVGILALIGRALFGGLQVLFWLLMPIIPVICLILFAAGMAPSWLQ